MDWYVCKAYIILSKCHSFTNQHLICYNSSHIHFVVLILFCIPEFGQFNSSLINYDQYQIYHLLTSRWNKEGNLSFILQLGDIIDGWSVTSHNSYYYYYFLSDCTHIIYIGKAKGRSKESLGRILHEFGVFGVRFCHVTMCLSLSSIHHQFFL